MSLLNVYVILNLKNFNVNLYHPCCHRQIHKNPRCRSDVLKLPHRAYWHELCELFFSVLQQHSLDCYEVNQSIN
jgi:hypothetical protein